MRSLPEHFSLEGRLAVVLGADNPAGDVIARAYREAGAKVAELEAEAPDTDKAVEAAALELGGLDILASCPGEFLAKPLVEITDAELARVLDRNFSVAFRACRAAVSLLRAREAGGNLVLVSDVLGERGLPYCSAYASAQGAIHNLIRALAQELAPKRISVNGIALGWMDWMEDRLAPDDPEAQRAIRFTIAKRAGTPEDIAALAVYLASGAVGYVTGQIFPVDGGLTQHL